MCPSPTLEDVNRTNIRVSNIRDSWRNTGYSNPNALIVVEIRMLSKAQGPIGWFLAG